MANNVLYECPLGQLRAVRGGSGERLLSYELVFGGSDQRTQGLVSDLTVRLRNVRSMFLPEVREVTASRIVWWVPGRVPLAPLSSLSVPLRPRQVDVLVRTLADALQALHEADIGAFDLAPAMVLVSSRASELVLIPSPFAAFQMQTMHVPIPGMPYVAPELLASHRQPSVDHVRADVYAVGALAWFLLTGRHRASASGELPSLVDAQLRGWDAFIDGSCRSNPARRFASPSDAVASIGTAVAASKSSVLDDGASAEVHSEGARMEPKAHATVAVPLTRPSGTRRRWASSWIVAVTLVVGIAVTAWLLSQAAGVLGPGPFGSGYRRGGAGTVVAYADRTYEGASWEELKEFEAFWTADPSRLNQSSVRVLKAVNGWDENNIWVVTVGQGRVDAALLRLRDGHWQIESEFGRRFVRSAKLIPRSKDWVLVALDWWGSWSLIESKSGVQRVLGTVRGDGDDVCVTVTSEGDIWVSGVDRDHAYRFENGAFKSVDLSRDRAALTYSEDNIAIADLPVKDLRASQVLSGGRALGFVSGLRGPDRAIVELRDGVWYLVDRLKAYGCFHFWVTESGRQLDSVSFASDNRRVVHWRGKGVVESQTVSVPSAPTSGELFRVWGVDLDKYWVMDTSGTVWEWSSGRWRDVVRGLYDSKVTFKDAWISPNGTVYAITDKSLYRLK